MNDAEKLAAIRARLDLHNDDTHDDKWASQPGYTLEDIDRILNDQQPMSTKENVNRG